MRLKSLVINRPEWGVDEGKLVGSIEFTNALGKVALSLNEEQINAIFKVCADAILTVAKAAAEELTCTVVEQKKEIGHDDKL